MGSLLSSSDTSESGSLMLSGKSIIEDAGGITGGNPESFIEESYKFSN